MSASPGTAALQPTSAMPSLPPGIDAEAEYSSIEQALLESALGRWFLAEHSRRARRVDSVKLDDALAKLRSSLRQPPALLGQLKTEVSLVRGELAAARARVLAKPEQQTTEPAPAAILASAEGLHQLAWTLQSAPIDTDACAQIARAAAEIYVHSIAQAAHSKRASDVAGTLSAALTRLDGILQTLSLEGDGEAALTGHV